MDYEEWEATITTTKHSYSIGSQAGSVAEYALRPDSARVYSFCSLILLLL